MKPLYTNFSSSRDILYVRELDENNQDVLKRLTPEYQVFTEAHSTKGPNTTFVGMRGELLSLREFKSFGDARSFINNSKGNMRLFYNHRMPYSVINDMYPDPEIDTIRSRMNVAWLDIEVESENGFPKPEEAKEVVNGLTLAVNKVYHVFGINHVLTGVTDKNVIYYNCKSEVDLLEKFILVWSRQYPHIVSGWNVKGFDIPYLVNRITKLLGERKVNELSPWKRISSKDKFDKFGNEEETFEIMGISIIDYLDLYQKFRLIRRDSYKLGNIAAVEKLTQQKRKYEGTLFDLYKRDMNEYLLYNLDDVKTVQSLDAKLDYINMIIRVAYQAKINFIDVFSQVKTWECLIMNEMKSRGIMPEQIETGGKSAAIEGAYVMERPPAPYDWIVALDLDSLYPSIIRMLNISPETIDPEARQQKIDIDEFLEKKTPIFKREEYTMGANGVEFSKEKQGIIPSMVAKMYADRKHFKKMMLEKKKLKEAIEKELATR